MYVCVCVCVCLFTWNFIEYLYYADKNPVMRFDMGELKAQAAMIEDEDPVAEFLSSNTFREVAPDGLQVGEK